MDTSTQTELNELVKRISSMPFVTTIFLFGSQAKGNHRKDSDVDLAVLTKNATNDQHLEIIGLSNDKFDISVFSRLPLVIQFRVIKEGKILFSNDEKYLNETKLNVFRFYWDFSTFLNIFYRRIIKNV